MKYGVCFDKDTTKILCNEDSNRLVYFQFPPKLVDIYYGINSNPTVTENIIKSTFFTESGLVGSPTGRIYIFPSGYCYKYWCIPDDPNTSERVINQITNGVTNTILTYDSYYMYYQVDPTPVQAITYGKITIDGVIYRIYRTINKSSSYFEQYVFSF